MKTITRIIIAATLGIASAGYAENGVELIQGVLAQTNHTPKVLLDVRARYEFGEQENLDPSHAGTIRARVGLESQDYNGFSGMIEFEATRAADTGSYRAAPYKPAGQTVIADPESTELNRMTLQFKRNDNLLIAGRQRIILDNARFVGNVGWRQNEQTYDAFTYKNTMIEDTSIYYGYIEEVKRIFGSDAPGAFKQFHSDSHLINASFTGLKGHKFTGYAYLLDFSNAKANNTDTVGVSWDVKGKIDEYAVNGYAEMAYQEEGRAAPVNYKALYAHLYGSVAREGYSFTAGYELLGSDNGKTGSGFKTPLATAHKFNGWNDQFLGTPSTGLQDFYLGFGMPVPKVPVKFVYHYFRSDSGSIEYGQEFDAVAAHAINPKLKAIAKFSFFDAASEVAAFSNDRTRFSVEMNYKY